MKKGVVMFIVMTIVLVFAAFIPSVNAGESKAYSRYKLVDSWVSGNTKTCLYQNVRKEQRTKSINKGRKCPSVY